LTEAVEKIFFGGFAVGKTPPKAVAQRRFQSRNAALRGGIAGGARHPLAEAVGKVGSLKSSHRFDFLIKFYINFVNFFQKTIVLLNFLCYTLIG
jgi:hypothetical protein